MPESLFRQEAIEHQAEHLGEVYRPPGGHWILLSLATFLAMVMAIIFVGSAEYEQKYAARGVLDEHNARAVMASGFGEVGEIYVNEGDIVERGDLLAIVSVDYERLSRTINFAETHHQLARWRAIEALELDEFRRSLSTNQALTRNNQGMIDIARTDTHLQASKLSNMKSQLTGLRTLLNAGHLTRQEWLKFKTSLISEQQRLNQFRQQLIELEQNASQLKATRERIEIEHKKTLHEIEMQYSTLRGHQASLASEHRIVSPIDGLVSRIHIEAGDGIQPGQPLVHLSTRQSAQKATLEVPAILAGNVRPGQRLALEFDAFPAAHHGRATAEVVRVTDHTVNIGQQSRYLATLILRPGGEVDTARLLPGMGFTAYLVRDRQSVFAWLMAPLYDWFAN